MKLKLVIALTLFVTVPVVAFVQKESPTTKAPKPTIADAQKLIQTKRAVGDRAPGGRA